MWRLTSFAFLVLAACSAPRPADYVSNEVLLHEKHGRLVDATTGAGVAGATVITVWYASAFGWHGSSDGCQLAKFVQTDAKGNYVIPDVSKELDVSHRRDPPWFSRFSSDSSWLAFSWRLIVYAPGYLREGDAEDFQKAPLSSKPMPIPGNPHAMWSPIPTVDFLWSLVPPHVTQTGSIVDVAPIRMFPTQLDPMREIVYYDRIVHAVNICGLLRDPPELEVIQKDMQQRIRNLPCTLPRSTIIGTNIVDDYMFLLWDPIASENMRKAGLTNLGPPIYKEATAGVLCDVVTKKGEENDRKP